MSQTEADIIRFKTPNVKLMARLVQEDSEMLQIIG